MDNNQNSVDPSDFLKTEILPKLSSLDKGEFFKPFTVYFPNNITKFTILVAMLHKRVPYIKHSNCVKMHSEVHSLVRAGSPRAEDLIAISFCCDLNAFVQELRSKGE